MWVMLITFFFYANAAQHESSASIAAVEFSSQATCEAARKQYLAQVAEPAKIVAEAAQRSIASGNLMGPNGVVLTVLCVKK